MGNELCMCSVSSNARCRVVWFCCVSFVQCLQGCPDWAGECGKSGNAAAGGTEAQGRHQVRYLRQRPKNPADLGVVAAPRAPSFESARHRLACLLALWGGTAVQQHTRCGWFFPFESQGVLLLAWPEREPVMQPPFCL